MAAVTLVQVALEKIPQSSNLLQSGYWGAVKETAGQKALAFLIHGSTPLLFLLRPFGPGLTLAYVPHGPGAPKTNTPETPPEEPDTFLKGVTEKVSPFLPKSCVFIRYDLPWAIPDDYVGFLGLHPPFKKSAVDIQPPHTVLVDLSPEEDTILGQMKSKTRYNIRLAFRKGVTVTEEPEDKLPVWYDLYRETAKRDKIAIHGFDYYAAPFSTIKSFAGPKPKLKLFFARHEGELLAGIIVACFGKRATYLYGASTDAKRNHMPAYALQWRAMQWAKSEGCIEYDLFGIPPSQDPDHPMHGLYRFKTGFGGKIIHRFGCWDYPVKPVLYTVAQSGEKMRDFYYKKLRKR